MDDSIEGEEILKKTKKKMRIVHKYVVIETM